MNFIESSEIIIPKNRTRRDIDEDKLNELANDIRKPHGLLHTPILRNDNKTLVAGERRFRAMLLLHEADVKFSHQGQRVPKGKIPYQSLAELSSLELLDAEISENIIRTDLSWQDMVKAYADLDDLRKLIDPKHTARETAAEILGLDDPSKVAPHHISNLVSNSVILVEHLDDPEIGKAATRKEAIKILTRKLEKEFTAELAAKYNVSPNSNGHILYHAKFEHFLKPASENKFDLIIADLPYGINADKVFGDMADLDHDYSDDPQEAIERYQSLAELGYKVTKEQSHLYIFCDPLWFSRLYDVYTKAGWWCAKAPIIWDKGNMGLLPQPDHMPRRSYETILFAIKGKREAIAVHRDVINLPNIANKIHAAQKPVDLYLQLIKRSCQPGDLVLDPACGSGTIFPAASLASCTAVGIEASEDSYNIAFSRIGDRE
jgi:DNA modification methylase